MSHCTAPHATERVDRGAAPRLQPNILLIFCDDLGSGDLGCTGSERIHTPTIDRLASEGMRFTQAYSSACVCAPSRCSILTGQSGAHAQIRDNGELPDDGGGRHGGQRAIAAGTMTVARGLQGVGYRTGCFGKWGLGGLAEPQGHPLDQGFDRFYGYLCQRHAHSYYPSYLESDRLQQPVDQGADGRSQYSGDLIADEALEWIGESADRAPWFLYYATTVPHLALQVPDDSLAQYTAEYAALGMDDPAYEGGKGYKPHSSPRAAYAAMITRLDQDVGRLLEAAAAHSHERETIVIFTSDNGGTFALGGFDPSFFQTNRGLRGAKTQLYEGGIRVPLIIRWPGVARGGSTCDVPVIGYDLFPTMLQAAGAAVPPSDGVDLRALIQSCDQSARPTQFVWEHPAGKGWRAARIGRWKCVVTKAKDPAHMQIELFDLELDPQESTDVASDHPDVVAQFVELFHSRGPSTVAEWEFPPLTAPQGAPR